MILTAHQYRDRTEAGQLLARQLAPYASRVDTLVLGLARDGIAIAAEVASYLRAPLDGFIVQKIEAPDHVDMTLGALTSAGVSVLDHEAIYRAGISTSELREITARKSQELKRREEFYREHRPPPHIAGRVVIIVDDGLASGFAMHAAIFGLLRQEPAWLVAAAPVGSAEVCDELAQEVHEVVCPLRPEPLESVGLWYDHFSPTNDDEVRACLRRASALPGA
jgi:putative phosphoribosyl transferase